MLLFLFACAGAPDAELDNDNWLEGDLVEKFDPKVAGVHIVAGTELHDGWHLAEVRYLDEATEPLAIVNFQWATEGGVTTVDTLQFPTAVELFSGDRYGSANNGVWPEVTVELEVVDDTATGTFAIFEGDALAGGFGAPIDWDNWD